MLQAFRNLRPTLGSALDTRLAALSTPDEKADGFLVEFLRSKTSKGEFAQELAGLIEAAIAAPAAGGLSFDSVPQYIRTALEFLGVINNQTANEPDGATAGTDPVPEAN